MKADPGAAQKTDGVESPDRRGLVISLVVNGLLPWVLYQILTRYTHLSEFQRLVTTSVPSLIDALVGVARRRKIDLLAGFTLFTIAVSLLLIALGGSPRLYLARESLLTGSFGLLALVSLFFPRPMMFYVTRYAAAAQTKHPGKTDSVPPDEHPDVDWTDPDFRRDMRAITLIFGVLTVAEAALRVHLAFTMPIPRFLVVSPLVFYGYGGLLFAAFALYKRLTPDPPRRADMTHEEKR